MIARLEDGAATRSHELSVAEDGGYHYLGRQVQFRDALTHRPVVGSQEHVDHGRSFGGLTAQLEAQLRPRRLGLRQAQQPGEGRQGEALEQRANDHDHEHDVEDHVGVRHPLHERHHRQDDGNGPLEARPGKQELFLGAELVTAP